MRTRIRSVERKRQGIEKPSMYILPIITTEVVLETIAVSQGQTSPINTGDDLER